MCLEGQAFERDYKESQLKLFLTCNTGQLCLQHSEPAIVVNIRNIIVSCYTVESMAGIQLIFFVVASMVLLWLCDQSSADNTGMFQLSSAYTGGRFFCFSCCPASQKAGKEALGRGQLGQFTPTDQQDIPQHIILCLTLKKKKKKKKLKK